MGHHKRLREAMGASACRVFQQLTKELTADGRQEVKQLSEVLQESRPRTVPLRRSPSRRNRPYLIWRVRKRGRTPFKRGEGQEKTPIRVSFLAGLERVQGPAESDNMSHRATK